MPPNVECGHCLNPPTLTAIIFNLHAITSLPATSNTLYTFNKLTSIITILE